MGCSSRSSRYLESHRGTRFAKFSTSHSNGSTIPRGSIRRGTLCSPPPRNVAPGARAGHAGGEEAVLAESLLADSPQARRVPLRIAGRILEARLALVGLAEDQRHGPTRPAVLRIPRQLAQMAQQLHREVVFVERAGLQLRARRSAPTRRRTGSAANGSRWYERGWSTSSNSASPAMSGITSSTGCRCFGLRSWQCTQFQRSGSFGVLLGNSHRDSAASVFCCSVTEKPPRADNLQLLGLPREHVQQHAQVDGLADAAGPQRGEHHGRRALRLRLVRQDHRRIAVAAESRHPACCLASQIRQGIWLRVLAPGDTSRVRRRRLCSCSASACGASAVCDRLAS